MRLFAFCVQVCYIYNAILLRKEYALKCYLTFTIRSNSKLLMPTLGTFWSTIPHRTITLHLSIFIHLTGGTISAPIRPLALFMHLALSPDKTSHTFTLKPLRFVLIHHANTLIPTHVTTARGAITVTNLPPLPPGLLRERHELSIGPEATDAALKAVRGLELEAVGVAEAAEEDGLVDVEGGVAERGLTGGVLTVEAEVAVAAVAAGLDLVPLVEVHAAEGQGQKVVQAATGAA